MNNVIKLRKGLDIRIEGAADGSLRAPVFFNEDYAVKPTDFWEVRPKLLVVQGDMVKAGSELFYDKTREKIRFTSPVSGVVEQIVYGPKRRIEEIRIKADTQIEYKKFCSYSAEEMALWKESDRGKAVSLLLESGAWPLLRSRPYDTIPNPDNTPRDIFISCFDTAPLAPDMDMAVYDKETEFQAGIDVIRTLTTGKVYLGLHSHKTNSPAFTACNRVEKKYFEGKHPCGNVGVQIHHISPINKGEEIWTINPQDVVIIGRLFLGGKYDATKIIALAGSEVVRTSYHKIISGVNIKYILSSNIKGMETKLEPTREDAVNSAVEELSLMDSKVRVISGNVLSGVKISTNGYLGFYDNLVSVIPEGNRYRFLGWITLGLNMFSFSRTFFSWIFRGRTYNIDTNMNGGNRAFVVTGEFEKVLPMDIYPMQLVKACLAKDIEAMENLGIYEVIPEDMALCDYIDASKNEIQQIIREGLDLIRKEVGDA